MINRGTDQQPLELTLRQFPPSFNEDATETAYRAHQVGHGVARARTAYVLAIVLYLAFAGLDRLLDEPNLRAFFAIRAAFSIWLCVILLTTWSRWWPKIDQLATSATIVLGASGIAAMIELAELEITKLTFFAGNMLILMMGAGFGLLRTLPCVTSLTLASVVTLVVQSRTGLGLPTLLACTFFMIGAIVAGGVGAFLLDRTERLTWRNLQIIESQRDEIDAQRQRADDLLHTILPAPIVHRLKAGEHPIADGFTEVTVLFADIEAFTPLAARIGPGRLVELLDDVFSAFDDAASGFGIEKVKTVGDAYMAVAGAPIAVEDHATKMVRFGMRLLDIAGEVGRLHGETLTLRVGINSGPVVAGVIGRQRIIYDLWGDTVNVASRIEGICIPGRLTVGKRTHDLLGLKFASTSRLVSLKGKGEVTVYDLIDPTLGLTA